MWRLIPVVLSCLILAAHFFRAELPVLSVICLVVAFLPFYRKIWVPQFMRWFLVLGSIEWLRALFIFTRERMELGQPWLRLVIILGAVMLVTFFSAFVFQNDTLKKKYLSAPDSNNPA